MKDSEIKDKTIFLSHSFKNVSGFFKISIKKDFETNLLMQSKNKSIKQIYDTLRDCLKNTY